MVGRLRRSLTGDDGFSCSRVSLALSAYLCGVAHRKVLPKSRPGRRRPPRRRARLRRPRPASAPTPAGTAASAGQTAKPRQTGRKRASMRAHSRGSDCAPGDGVITPLESQRPISSRRSHGSRSMWLTRAGGHAPLMLAPDPSGWQSSPARCTNGARRTACAAQTGHHPADAGRAVHEACFMESHPFRSGLPVCRASRVARDLHGYRHLWCRPQSDRCVPPALAGPIRSVARPASAKPARRQTALMWHESTRGHARCSRTAYAHRDNHAAGWRRAGAEPNLRYLRSSCAAAAGSIPQQRGAGPLYVVLLGVVT